MKRLCYILLMGMILTANAAPKKQSPIISLGKDRLLIYDQDEHGNRAPDFSRCGYAGGDQPIPTAPVRVVVAPKAGDRTAYIQAAINYVASLPADTNGLRGAVLLLRGRHEVFGGLQITNSGVILRGQGAGADGTILMAAGLDRRTLIRINGQNDLTTQSNADWEIQDDYVPVGASSFQLKAAGGLIPGTAIQVIRPSTKAWIDQLGATEFGGGIGDWRLTWKSGSRDLTWDRVVLSVSNNTVTVDAPITTAIEKAQGTGRVQTYAWSGRIENIGIENIRLESAVEAANPMDENHSWCAITMENTRNAWVRQVTARHFAGSMVAIYESCEQISVQDCLSLAPVSENGGYRRHTFFTMGQLTLFLRCFSEAGRHDFSVGHCAAGPNAFVQCETSLSLDDSGAIESWASGTLFDNVRVDGNGLDLSYRGPNGEGAGWSAANSVLWNCSASQIHCENPPGARNWSFGSWGEFFGDGLWRNSNASAEPNSLFAAQRAERFGSSATGQIQLMPRSTREASNPTVEEAAALIAASHTPAPQLSDYITNASSRDPIFCELGEAKPIEEILAANPQENVFVPQHRISITNGWIVCDGKLLVGGNTEVAWWRGNVRPVEAAANELSLTRFVPGRIGRGYSDDLNAVADQMTANGTVSLDQHYGLWYDRRRDDHERVRRMTGDVWPPFYEQAFARSGQGKAWDGLSKYDLTKFNPWYWDRLQQFASICDQRGLVLFHQNFFQHNIIEAGAHWADCPWRSANNINETGFPEPPPFAGDKRIFMADQFYDENNPVRRAIYRGFIRHCLDNFTNQANVIQFTSAEFTGPGHFMAFWLDTVAEWERDTGRKALVALSCTKDVQDAMLADPTRNAVVDVIDFQYWWQTGKGLYAPKGGQNLSPRQFERQWRGGNPNDRDLAQMAATYRNQFPGKALLAHFSKAGWAYLCAGGSIPNLPLNTDPQLLAAIPAMQPRPSAENETFTLGNPESGYLIYAGASANVAVDLTSASGKFSVKTVSDGGVVSATGNQVDGGGKVTLKKSDAGARVFWLVKD